MRDIRVSAGLLIPESEVRESFARSAGPGGQNVNKLSTKVELRWSPEQSAVLSEADRAYLLRRLGNRLTEGGASYEEASTPGGVAGYAVDGFPASAARRGGQARLACGRVELSRPRTLQRFFHRHRVGGHG